jgi:phospholipid/cholesterol/gamma-HCH transport system substrate-binding protein
MQHSRVLETWVGVFVALGLLGLFFLAMQVSNLGALKFDDRSYTVTARFSNIGSLKVRAPVSMSGVRVGRVSAIRFDRESYEAVVEMRIEPYFNTLPSDTSASILTQGLLGEQYIGLTPGGMDDPLRDGDKIEMTQSAMILEQLISRFLFSKAEEGSDKEHAGSTAPSSVAVARHAEGKAVVVNKPVVVKKAATASVKTGVAAAQQETKKNGQH